MLKSSNKNQTKMLNSIMNFLPDDRPVTDIQIVENHTKCPKNFIAIHRSYDQDSDADLYKEKILLGKRTTRYLCLSKTEGYSDMVIEQLSVISEKEMIRPGFSLITKTADSGSKAWKKKQIIFKYAKRGHVTEAVTDVIVCTRLKTPPTGFKLAGEMNGALICFKLGPVTHRPPPAIPNYENTNEIDTNINRLSLNLTKSLYPTTNGDYENVSSVPPPISPRRIAPKPPITPGGTLGTHTELDGVPFTLNPNLSSNTPFQMPSFDIKADTVKLDYDFHLERQVLCTTKTNNLTNPFFK